MKRVVALTGKAAIGRPADVLEMPDGSILVATTRAIV